MVAAVSSLWNRNIKRSYWRRKHKIAPQCQSLSTTTPSFEPVVPIFLEGQAKDCLTDPTYAIPIAKLPVELLMEIFHICTEVARSTLVFPGVMAEYGEFRRNHSRYLTLHCGYDRTAPFNLLQVCRTWRSIALNTSGLWKSLSGRLWAPRHLYDAPFSNNWFESPRRLPPIHLDQYHPTIPEMSHWLTLSGSAPLRLQLQLDHDHYVQSSLYQLTLLRLFATQAHRWQALSIEVDTALTQELVSILRYHEQEHGFPSLERLDINFDRQPLPDQHIEIMNVVSSLKNLRHIMWYARCFDAHHSIHLPWNQLHSVYIDSQITAEGIMLYLAQCTAATDITFRKLYGTEPLDLDNRPVILLPFLKHFHLDGYHVLPLFKGFLFPALETLEIEVFTSRSTAPYEILDDFLTRSGCRMKAVVVREGSWKESLLPDIATKFFSMASLNVIPIVELQHVHIHRALLQVIQNGTDALKGLRTIPRLLGWTDSAGQGVVGWKELGKLDTLRFLWERAALHIIKPIPSYQLHW